MSKVAPTESDSLPSESPVLPGQRHMGALQLIALSGFWFATNAHWTALIFVVLPRQVELMTGPQAAARLGLLLGAGSVLALVVPLIVGPLSDRCISVWGRRRPYMAAGVAVNAIGLAAMVYLSG